MRQVAALIDALALLESAAPARLAAASEPGAKTNAAPPETTGLRAVRAVRRLLFRFRKNSKRFSALLLSALTDVVILPWRALVVFGQERGIHVKPDI